MMETTYVHVEQTESPDEAGEGAANSLTCLLQDLLAFDYEMSGLYGFEDIVNSMPPGYLELQYERGTESEYSDGYCLARYDVVDNIVSWKPAPFWGRWLFFKNFLLPDWLHKVSAPFRKIWWIEWEYGGAGIHQGDLWLPRALWYRWVQKNRLASWGPGWTKIRMGY